MLHKPKSRKTAIFKYGLTAPLLVLMLIFSSVTGADLKTIILAKKTVAPLIEDLDISDPEPALIKEKQLIKINPAKRDTGNLIRKPIGAPKNLYDYVGALYESARLSKVGKEGNIYVSFKVGKNKRPTGFKIMRSIGSEWENELIKGLDAFSEPVDMPEGRYHFTLGFAYGGNEDLVNAGSEQPAALFHRWRTEGPGVGTATELEDGVEVHNTYVSFNNWPDPIVLVDGNEVNYTSTKMGLKLSQAIYPKVSASSKAIKGDTAVKLYGEKARKGIIVIETKDPS